MRTVKNILESKAKPDNVVPSSTLVIEGLKKLISVNLSYLIVMDQGEYKGIFSERDYSRNIVLKGRASDSTTVGEAMATDLPEVVLTDTVENCMKLLTSNRVRYLVAFNADHEFAGVITIHDLLRSVIANKEEIFDESVAHQLIDHDESGDIY